ncbi:AAA family ATPase [Methanobacterium sp.]|uniref:AAA family ATPase n=1 Tax=Methanobacterium sp. TaxID=2164 RepID=UPI0025CC18AD|nr:AAA family ATPase [Methanobacterium sp.]MBI5460055.1 AAA family ATPase [Methanobacterium sp.]
MTPAKKGESALGRGLDALIRKEKPKNEDKQGNVEKTVPVEKKAPGKTAAVSSSKVKSSPKVRKPRKPKEDPNKIIIDGVVLEVRKNPRISLWSAKSAAVLRFLKNTKPAFSISKEASALIEEAVQQKYPEIWEMFEKEDF